MENGQKDASMIVAFIDLLGTTKRINENIPIDEALTPIDSYNTILGIKLNEYRINPPNEYEEEFQVSAKMRSVDSFDFFLPASDSIFLMSRDCNSFIKQLGYFVLDSYTLTTGYYKDSKGKSKIEEISDGHCWYPPLFRGGIAYDSARSVDVIKIVNGEPSKTKILAGKAVNRAVELEEQPEKDAELKIKGPRLLFKKEVYDQLYEDTRDYCRITPEKQDLYEVLWPAFNYFKHSKPTQNTQEIDEIRRLLDPTFNLWKSYKKDKSLSIHYFNLIELIIASIGFIASSSISTPFN